MNNRDEVFIVFIILEFFIILIIIERYKIGERDGCLWVYGI